MVSFHYQRCYQQLADQSQSVASAFYQFHRGPVDPGPLTPGEQPKTADDLQIAVAIATFTTIAIGCCPLACLWAYRNRSPETSHSNRWLDGKFSSSRWGGFLAAKFVSFLSILAILPLLKGQPKSGALLTLQLTATVALLFAYLIVDRVIQSQGEVPEPKVPLARATALHQLGFGIASFSLICTGNFAISWLQNLLQLQNQSSNPLLALVMNSSGVTLGLWIVVLVVLGPLAEELWYRAMLMPAIGLLPSALLFALVHSDPRVFLPLAWTGLMLGWAYRRGGLLSSWLAHGLWNGLVTATLLGARGSLGLP